MKRTLVISLAGLALSPIAAALAQSAQTTETPQTQTTPQAPASTQNPPPPTGQNVQNLQTITVTGSAIPRIDLETPSPVTTITAAQIQRSGLTTLSDVVRAISADNSGSIPNAFANGFAAGSSGVALRGLTVNSTLVLIDGHRVANYPVADDGQRHIRLPAQAAAEGFKTLLVFLRDMGGAMLEEQLLGKLAVVRSRGRRGGRGGRRRRFVADGSREGRRPGP